MSTQVSQHTEFRRVGPPGTGKTTWISRQAAIACQKQAEEDEWGDGQSSILFSSLTKAAASELLGRGMPVSPESIGTLHAHAYRALGRPKLCVDAKDLAPFNEAHPEFALAGDRRRAPDQSDDRGDTSRGDRLLAEYHVLRSRLTERDLWPSSVADFARVYEQWKFENEVLDFSDVIHDACLTCPTAPGDPRVIFVDECQDHDRAELRLVRRWAERAEKVILVGDPDQCLYEWRGSDPDAFYDHEIPPGHERVLSQSYRVPRAVHAEAMAMIGRVKGRREVEYQPRPADGRVERADFRFSAPCVDDLARDAVRRIESGHNVMFLSACDYSLKPLIGRLRERGIPYWNPYARDRAEFNPLHPAKGVRTATRLLDFLRPEPTIWGDDARLWTAQEFWSFAELTSSDGWLKRGARTELKRLAADDAGGMVPLTIAEVRGFLSTPEIPGWLRRTEIAGLLERTASAKAKPLLYATKILAARGVAGLREEPRCVVGTIHSVKGGEADVVYLCPDLSPQGYDQLDSRDPAPVYRQFYVGMTRAKETLILCDQQSARAIEW